MRRNIINLFEPTLKAKVIKFDATRSPEMQKEIAEGLGNFPFVWYGDFQIEPKDISFLQLSNNIGLPTLQLNFTDPLNLMKDTGFPLDDSKISIFINPRSQVLKPIHMDFKIVKFDVLENSYTINAVIDVNDLYLRKFKSISNSTSFDALKSISKEIGLGFNSNIDGTNDKMTWICAGNRIIDFINIIVDQSYKSDETFLLSYIDVYYNLTYVDLEKELSRDLKSEIGINNIGIEELVKLDNKETVGPLFLTNDFSQKDSNNFFEDWRVINNSTTISLNEGYLTKVKFYDQLKKDLLIFDIDSISTPGDTGIILKGQPQDLTFYKENVNLIYKGKMDTDNMHTNFHYSNVQNLRNIVDLEKIGIEITLVTPNFNLYRYQKVILIISNLGGTPSASQINNRLTGEWLIVDIIFRFDGSKFRQIIKLVRRELTA